MHPEVFNRLSAPLSYMKMAQNTISKDNPNSKQVGMLCKT